MFLKPAKSDTENGNKKILKMSPKKIIYSGNWKLEKNFERYQNNTVIAVDYMIT